MSRFEAVAGWYVSFFASPGIDKAWESKEVQEGLGPFGSLVSAAEFVKDRGNSANFAELEDLASGLFGELVWAERVKGQAGFIFTFNFENGEDRAEFIQAMRTSGVTFSHMVLHRFFDGWAGEAIQQRLRQ